MSSRLGLVAWIALCVVGGALIGVLTGGGDSLWYQGLRKPAWNPTGWVFAPVWTTLYALMGIAAWRIWRLGGWPAHRTALNLFLAQLACNFAWSFLFFSLQQIALAFLDIVVLWVLIVATIRRFGSIDRPAAALLLPYLAWVSFATVLNGTILFLNRTP
jgi:benzodiazapine receptor